MSCLNQAEQILVKINQRVIAWKMQIGFLTKNQKNGGSCHVELTMAVSCIGSKK